MMVRAQAFAQGLGVDQRSILIALKLAFDTKPWRGHHLPVGQLDVERGGAGGVTWAIGLERATPAWLADIPALDELLDPALVPAVAAYRPEVDPRRTRVQGERLDLIKPDIGMEAILRAERENSEVTAKHFDMAVYVEMVQGALPPSPAATPPEYFGREEARGGFNSI